MTKKIKKRAYLIISIFIVFFVLFFIVYNTKFGENLLKSYIASKLTILKQFNINSFKYSLNSFSLMLKKDNNYIYIYGNLFPFNATYEANFDNLSSLTKELRGSLKSSGGIKYKNIVLINGNALFANGYSTLKFQCDKVCVGLLSGHNFNTQKLLYMLKIDLPYIQGNNDLYLICKENSKNIKSHFKVNFKKDNFDIKNLVGKIEVNYKNRENFNFDLVSQNNFIDLKLKGLKNNNNLMINGNIKAPLNIFKEYTLYNLRGVEDINFSYDSTNNVLKFSNENFNGSFYEKTLFVNINNMPSQKFFRVLNLKAFFKAPINGIIKIKYNEGNFDLVVNNPIVIPINIISYISKITGAKLNKFDILFLKGSFDSNKVVFSLLAKNSKSMVSIKEGVYFYNGNTHYLMDFTINNQKKYIFEVNNNNIKLLKTIKSEEMFNKETLVY